MAIIQQLIEQVWDVITLPHLDQGTPYWQEDGTCCIGARLAHALDVPSGYYLHGVDEFARRAGGTRAHVILMLRQAGAGEHPLDAYSWPHTVEHIFRNLIRMEELPSLRHAILDREQLSDCDLSGLDLTGAYLRDAYLNSANLTNTNLTNAVLDRTQLHNANLQGANLAGATITGADFYNAVLTETQF